MKKIILVLTVVLWSNTSYTQTDPTLAVGLETLTYGKGTIDVELLTEIIMEKQKELKQEALKRFMFNLFPEGNYTTKFYLQNALHILMNEQNPEVIKKELLEILTNYSLALGFTIAYQEIHPEYLEQTSNTITNVKDFSDNYLNDFDDYLKRKKGKFLFIGSTIEKINQELKSKEDELNHIIKSAEIVDFISMKYQVQEFIRNNPVQVESWLFDEISNNIDPEKYNVVAVTKTIKDTEKLIIQYQKTKKPDQKKIRNLKQKIPSLLKAVESKKVLLEIIENKKVLNLFHYYLSANKIDNSNEFYILKNWLSSILNKINYYNLSKLIAGNSFVNINDFKDTHSLEDNRKKIQQKYLNVILKTKNNTGPYSSALENGIKKEDFNKVISIIKHSTNSKYEDIHLYKVNETMIKDYLIIDNEIKKLIDSEEISYPKKELFELFGVFENDLKREKALIKQISLLKSKINDKSIRKGINNSDLSQIDYIKSNIPFGLLLDIVSTSLSKNDTLQNKGFFKYKINYIDGSAFTNLTPEARNEIKNLEQHISKTINDYVSNYHVLKEIKNNFKNIKDDFKNPENIFLSLSKKYNEEFEQHFYQLSLKEIKDIYLSQYSDPLIIKQIDKAIKDFDDLENLLKTITKEADFLIEQSKLIEQILSQWNKEKEFYHQNWYVIEKYISQAKLLSENLGEFTKLKNVFDDLKKIGNKQKAFQETTLIEVNNFKNKVDQIEKVKDKSKLKIDKDIDSLNAKKALKAINNWLKNIKIKDFRDNKILTFKNDIIQPKKKEILDDLLDFNQGVPNKDITKKIMNILLLNLKRNIESKIIFTNDKDSVSVKKIAKFTKAFYLKVNRLIKTDNIKISDIYDLQNKVLPEIIELKVLSPKSEKALVEWQNRINLIIPFLNIKAIEQIENQILTKEQITKITELLGFIANLDNLDKAETFEHIINLFRDGNDEVNKHLKDGEFKNLYNLFSNAVKKYTLVNSKEQYIEVDVASFLVELEGYYDKNNTENWSFYLGIGLSQNFFLDRINIPGDTEPTRSVGFASEKLGVKYKIMDFQRSSDYTNLVPNDIYLSKRSPFVNEWYANAYGSGLLYSLANTTTNENFDFAHLGFGSGIRFYNALDFSLNIGFPLGEKSKPLKDAFVGFGFDIPLSEYLTRSKRKRAKKSKSE